MDIGQWSGGVGTNDTRDGPTSSLTAQDSDPCSQVNCRLALDRNSPVPLWAQIETYLAAAIADQRLRPGQTLCREDELAARFRVCRPTLRQALAGLSRRGLIIRRRGIGTQVARAVATAC